MKESTNGLTPEQKSAKMKRNLHFKIGCSRVQRLPLSMRASAITHVLKAFDNSGSMFPWKDLLSKAVKEPIRPGKKASFAHFSDVGSNTPDLPRSGLTDLRIAFAGVKGLVDEAAGAITTFLEAAKECAGRKGPMLPGDSLAIWKACVAGPKMLDADFYEDSYAARMSQAQWLFIQTAENAARCITVAMQRELYAISGVIANMGKTRKVDVVLKAPNLLELPIHRIAEQEGVRL
jgi:hypothetical protein